MKLLTQSGGSCRCLVLALTALFCGCSSQVHPVSGSAVANAAMANASAPLLTPTFDGSGQAMHPGIVEFATAWHGYKYWMCMTPYTNADARAEDPSILVSQDGLNWEAPSGATEPVATPVGFNTFDADLFYDSASDQIWLYYMDSEHDGFHLKRKTSADGVNWSLAQEVLTLPLFQMLSPTVEKTQTGYALWTVNGGKLGCHGPETTVELRTSTDGISWTAPQTVNLHQPGYHVWHIDVRFVPSKNEYWAVYAAYPAASCGTTSLFFARSSDGVNWATFFEPLLNPGTGWDSGQIYRSTILYDAGTDTLRLWYSARNKNQVWHTGYSEAPFSEEQGFLHHSGSGTRAFR
jgi:hypothetical protein